jgi:hypothetical protein
MSGSFVQENEESTSSTFSWELVSKKSFREIIFALISQSPL